MPSRDRLEAAGRLQADAAARGFDWPDAGPVFAKVREELAELEAHGGAGASAAAREEELGDLLFVCVNLARHLDVDPVAALDRANAKFQRRFARVAQLAESAGTPVESLSLEALDRYWDQAKREGL